MKGVIIHGALLGVMLIYGYRTWTKQDAAKPTTGEVVMWTRGESDLKTIEFTSEKRTVKLERKGQGADAYWWGTESKQTKKPNPPAQAAVPAVPDDPATPDVNEAKPAVPEVPADPPFTTETTTTEFPIGPEGEKLVKQYARMRAIKSIGVPSAEAKKDYGLDESQTSVAAVFADGSKTLVVGGKVFGGSDRYLQDLDTGKVFVVLGSMVSLLEGGETSLRPVELRSFDPKTAQQIEIVADNKRKSVTRIKVKPPAPETPDPHTPPPSGDELVETWGQGQTADTTAANFIDKLEKLRPSSYDPKVTLDSLEAVAALNYKDGKGKPLGTFKLLRRVKAAEPKPDGTAASTQQFEYFVWTERTRVPASVSSMQAERVEQDVATLFDAQ